MRKSNLYKKLEEANRYKMRGDLKYLYGWHIRDITVDISTGTIKIKTDFSDKTFDLNLLSENGEVISKKAIKKEIMPCLKEELFWTDSARKAIEKYADPYIMYALYLFTYETIVQQQKFRDGFPQVPDCIRSYIGYTLDDKSYLTDFGDNFSTYDELKGERDMLKKNARINYVQSIRGKNVYCGSNTWKSVLHPYMNRAKVSDFIHIGEGIDENKGEVDSHKGKTFDEIRKEFIYTINKSEDQINTTNNSDKKQDKKQDGKQNQKEEGRVS